MSSSVNVHTYVGFEVQHSELWSKVVAEKETCPKGHPKEGEAAFCGRCGGKFSYQQREVPTEGLVRLLKVMGVAEPYDKLEAYDLENLNIGVNVRAVTNGDDREKNCLAVAVRLTTVSDYDRRLGTSKNKLEVLLVFDQMEALRQAFLGDEAREVKLFTQLYYC